MGVYKYIKFANGYIPIYEDPSSFTGLILYEWLIVVDHSSTTMNNYSIGAVISTVTFDNGAYIQVVKNSATRVAYIFYNADNTVFTTKTQTIGATYSYSVMGFFSNGTSGVGWYGWDGRRNEFDVFTPGAPAVASFLTDKTLSNASYTLDFTDYLSGAIVDEIPTDPYGPGGDTGDDDTGGEGGDGDFDGTTEPIDFPDLPTVSAVDTKFITIFNPTKAQLISLAEYMWSPLFDIDTLKKLWANPMDCILGLTMVPFSVPDGGQGPVSIGNVSTGISMTKAGSQYVSVDCGSINVKEFWGGYLDYDPYTKFQIYLPYIGIKPLLADEIMGKSIHVKYHCDILTGACNCFIKCGGSVLYSFNGQCSTQIPISGNDWRNTISAAINIAGQAAGMYVTGGATAPMAITSIAQSAVNGLKQSVEKSGSLSGTGGMLAIQKPYLIATRPIQAVAKNQNQFTGYPAFITRTLSSCSGYTEVYSCHLENIPCTADELNEIENLLKAGVIL